jgi:hypothetical protein
VDLQELRLIEHDRQRAVLPLRVVAALRHTRPTILALAAALLVATAGAGTLLAADPTAEPGGVPAPPTCAERYPEAGPAGLDLRLGCIIGELAGHYTAAMTQDATPASTYALVVAGIVVAGLLAIWLAARFVRGAAGRRLAPVRPGEWWLCATCRSVNGAGVQHCYSCGTPPPDGPTMRTDDAPSTSQSFGSTRKRG